MSGAVPYLIAASAGVSAYAAIRQGQAAKAASKFNAAIAEQNAVLARQEAQDLARQQSRENYLRLGAIRAAQGKSGGAADEGSVLDIIGDAASQGELQRQYILRSGELKAGGFQNTAMLDRMSGKNAQTAGYLQAGSTLLSGAAGYYYAGGTFGTGASKTSSRSAYNSDFTLKRS